MLSAHASCLETHAFFFFFGVNVTSFLLFKERERSKGRRRRRWGTEVSEIPCKRSEPRPNLGEIAWKTLTRTLIHKAPVSGKTNLKRNLGNQLRSSRELEKKEGKGPPFSFLPPSLHVFSSPPLNRDMDLPIRTLQCVRRLCQHGLYLFIYFLRHSALYAVKMS